MSNNEWELSKENVQPIRQGRHLSNLSAGLQSTEDQIAQMRKEKQQFEAELRTYSGDDPLEVWHRYLIWTEQNCVKGGKENNLEKLLENYLKQYSEETRYHSDPRYVSAWIRYANMCKEPLDIYNYMFDQKIGNELSCFYESWAWALEQMGNTKKANMIYQEGIKRQAEPLDVLERKYNNFQMRVARGLAGKVMDDAPEESIEQRAALCQLKTTGRKVPVNRLDAAKPKSRGLGLQPVKPAQIGQTFQIFNDENQDPSLPYQQGDWSDVPTRSSVNKENEKKPGVWTKAKVPCKAAAPPSTPSFTLYVEENADQPMTTPRKLPEVGNQILSARKPSSKPVDNLYNVRHEQSDPTHKPMYSKEKVYCGAEEYSFEEIRAAKWFAQKKREDEKRRLEEEQKLIEEQREQLRRNQLMLQQEAEQFRIRQQTLQQEHQAIIEQCKSEIQRQQDEFKRERELIMLKQKEMLEKEIEERMNAGLAAAAINREKTSSKQLNFERLSPSQNSIPEKQNMQQLSSLQKKHEDLSDHFTVKSKQSENQVTFGIGSHSQNENIHKDSVKPLQENEVQKNQHTGLLGQEEIHQQQNKSVLDVQNNSYRTPVNKSLGLDNPEKHSGPTPNSGSRLSLSAPSPTVNAKEAMQLVMGMFNASLAIGANLGWDDDDDNMLTAPHQLNLVPAPSTSNAPFTIFNEEEMDTAQNGNKENDENRLPNKSSEFVVQRRKGLSGGAHQSIRKDSIEAMDYDGKMESIESQARDDFTICPIGTNQSFAAAAARVASTPFSRTSPLDSFNDVSRINNHVESSDVKTSIHVHTDTQSCFHTSKEEIKDLSPIMEGSNEDSSGHNGQSTVNSVFHSQHQQSNHIAMETDACSIPKFEDLNQSTHVIDTRKYIPSPSVHLQIKPRNPFDEHDIEKHLKTLSRPLSSYPNYIERNELLQEIRVDDLLTLGDDMVIPVELIGKGGYAKVYKISTFDYCNEGSQALALKVQSPPCPWEFYICNELQERLSKMNSAVDIRPAMMNAKKGYFFNNCSCILTDYHPHGTLLDLVNKLTKCNSSVGEPLAMYVTIEMLYMIEYLHKCQIIHGDVKPDNLLLTDIPKLKKSADPKEVFGGSHRCMQLIDFGQSIDMAKYPKGTTFMAKVKTSGFQCIQMQTDQPWTYQTDLFGLVGTIHVLLFRKYMQVYQSNGEWKITSSLVRAWNVSLWKKLFQDCLNIPSCDQIPDISQIRREFEDYFVNNLLDKYNDIQSALVIQLQK